MSTGGEIRRSGAQTRAAVLDAAERLFARHGYRGTSLEEVGREAGLSRGTPGYFFGSKERLYAEMLERILSRAKTALADATQRIEEPDLTLHERINELVAAHVELLAAEPMLVRLIQWETLDGQGRILAEIAAHARPLVDLLRGFGTDDRPPLSEEAAVELLTGAAALCWFPFAHAVPLLRTFRRDPRDLAALAAQSRAVVEFVLGRLAPPALNPRGSASQSA